MVDDYVKHASRYRVGTYTFSEMIEGGYFYIDKTEYIYKMTHDGSKYIFLSRPRRFGKSMTVSTLISYFEGRNDLFKGLAIDRLETKWEQYPVIILDMGMTKGVSKEEMDTYLADIINDNEHRFNFPLSDGKPSIRLKNLIIKLYEQFQKKVVVLVDEYDSPLLEVAHEEENLPVLREIMRNFYTPLKTCDKYIHFAFITGITKFSQVSIFSSLNNITNISMRPEYDAICGITEEELMGRMPGEVDRLAAKSGKTRQEALRDLKLKYDGYHFTWPSPDLYNPYSLMRALSEGDTHSYWFETGTPLYLIETIRKYGVIPQTIEGTYVSAADFDAPIGQGGNIIPLLYQSGYLTITDYDPDSGLYRLDVPNREVRAGLYGSLLPNYFNGDQVKINTLITSISTKLNNDKIEDALKDIQTFFSTFSYITGANTESHYQYVLAATMSACGIIPRVEERTSMGRIDMVFESSRKIYLFEIKLDKSAEEALRQINEKDYASRYSIGGLQVVKVGLNFSSRTRTLTGWIVEE